MSVEIIIDTREQELIARMSTNNNISVEQLDIGDILFRQNNENILIIERKTVNDLKASICDGRGREQKARLMGTTPKHRIMYLIEGSLNKSLESKVSGLPVSTLIGSLINTQLRDGIKVYKTSSIEESVNFLYKLHDKLEKDGETYFKEEQSITASKYSSTLKKQKKANMTPHVWFITQLSLIPQVTDKIASVIVEKYPTIRDLMMEYESTPEHLREKLLADLKFTIKNDKERRVGDKISSRIYQYYYGYEQEINEE
jgi:ERCC4-type nuclease